MEGAACCGCFASPNPQKKKQKQKDSSKNKQNFINLNSIEGSPEGSQVGSADVPIKRQGQFN